MASAQAGEFRSSAREAPLPHTPFRGPPRQDGCPLGT